MKMQKLLTMAPAEIAFRGRQAMFKTAERVGHSARSQVQQEHDLFATLAGDGGDSTDPAALYRSGDIGKAMKRLQADFQHAAGHRFFTGATAVQAPDLLASYLPRIRSEIVESADAVCAGHFHTLGYGRLSFYHGTNQLSVSNDLINWHLDAVSGTISPLVHWSRINALDFAEVGDSKVVWELNRHQWLIQLGLAWKLTGDNKYTAVFSRRMQAWMRDNPTGYGINWSSSLEVAYRLISWCWALVLFKDSTDVSAQFQASMMSCLRTHAEHVERYLSTYYSPNTHLTGEALALYYAGVLFPEIGGAKRWRTLGRKILLQQFNRQVHNDGVYFEQSTRYQYYTVEIYLQFMILSQRNGETLPKGFSMRVQAMVDFLLNLRRPDGTVPQIGDTDGGALLSIVHRQPGDYQALFAIAAALFEREDYAWAAGDSTAELICLLGPVGHYRFMALKQKAPPVVEACLFADGGYLIMRDGWRPQGHQLIFDVGPLGCSDSAAHGHADLLSLQCSAFGDNYLIDPGTGNYTSEPQWRNYFRCTQAHSTVSVDGRSQ
ncbi:MAG: alginate lyase family protein, partial [Pseudohongiella sp.]